MPESRPKLILEIRPSPFAAPFHHLFTRPGVEIDGTETALTWGWSVLRVAPGAHRVEMYFRYRGQKHVRLGRSSARLHTGWPKSEPEPGTRPGPPSDTYVRARLGLRNGSLFEITGDTVG